MARTRTSVQRQSGKEHVRSIVRFIEVVLSFDERKTLTAEAVADREKSVADFVSTISRSASRCGGVQVVLAEHLQCHERNGNHDRSDEQPEGPERLHTPQECEKHQ
jgi:hypothetical protein